MSKCILPVTLYKDTNKASLTSTFVVPCGKCPPCLRKRQNEWLFRLQQEEKNSLSSAFITLTYENEPLSFNGHATLEPDHLKNFWKRLRKFSSQYQPKHYNKTKNKSEFTYPIRYMAVGEYGTKTLRPHYHAIVYNLPHFLLKNSLKLPEIWGHGHIDIANAESASMRYVIGYIMNGKWQPTQDDDDRYPQFQRQSQGLGKSYLTSEITQFYKERLLSVIQKPQGELQSMPRYYKDKIFTRSEKKRIAKHNKIIYETDYETYINNLEWEIPKLKDKLRSHEKQLMLNTKTQL